MASASRYGPIESILYDANADPHLTTKEYWDRIFTKQTPLLVKKMLIGCEWPAMTSKAPGRKWTFPNLAERLCDEMVTVEVFGDYMSKSMQQVTVSFEDLVTFIDSKQEGHIYLITYI